MVPSVYLPGCVMGSRSGKGRSYRTLLKGVAEVWGGAEDLVLCSIAGEKNGLGTGEKVD